MSTNADVTSKKKKNFDREREKKETRYCGEIGREKRVDGIMHLTHETCAASRKK